MVSSTAICLIGGPIAVRLLYSCEENGKVGNNEQGRAILSVGVIFVVGLFSDIHWFLFSLDHLYIVVFSGSSSVVKSTCSTCKIHQNPHFHGINPHFLWVKVPLFSALARPWRPWRPPRWTASSASATPPWGKWRSSSKPWAFSTSRPGCIQVDPGGFERSNWWLGWVVGWIYKRIYVWKDPTFYDRTMENGDLCPKIRGLGVNIQLITWMGWMGLGFKWIYHQEKFSWMRFNKNTKVLCVCGNHLPSSKLDKT